jgi:CRISPR/Cas system CSM-associated protein Csm3 (group 7 of RAMP superfamily)
MPENVAHWETSRQIVKRVVISGKLKLLTPTQIGSGEPVGPTDMTLLRDPLTTTRALLPGASIAGALRNYLREREYGYDKGVPDDKAQDSPVVRLFGGRRGDDEGGQSLLIVDDALSEEAQVEIRDGVRIEPETSTAAKGAKFDMELLRAGTTFNLRFELLIPQDQTEELEPALARALQGFEREEIALGARKRRGFGRCKVTEWRVVTYDLTTLEGLQAWLNRDETVDPPGSDSDIAKLLGVEVEGEDKRRSFTMDLTCELDGSLLIRAASQAGSDAGHLHTIDATGERMMVLPGTSLAGVLRHRALRITNTLSPDGDGSALVEAMFGSSPKEEGERQPTASRVWVRETKITRGRSLVQSRVKIDRFTGGAYPTALFSEEPLFGGQDSRVKVHVTLRSPQPLFNVELDLDELNRNDVSEEVLAQFREHSKILASQAKIKVKQIGSDWTIVDGDKEYLIKNEDQTLNVYSSYKHEVGLLLLLLKDLWTGDLTVGGESSVGRGRLRGIKARLHWNDDSLDNDWNWTLRQTEDSKDGLQIPEEARELLENAVAALKSYLKEVADETAQDQIRAISDEAY